MTSGSQELTIPCDFSEWTKTITKILLNDKSLSVSIIIRCNSPYFAHLRNCFISQVRALPKKVNGGTGYKKLNYVIFRFDRISLLSKKTQIATYKGRTGYSREINVQKKISPFTPK